jgi:hypothetical protein
MMPPGFRKTSEGGLEAVLATLREEDFPMDKQNLYYTVGDLNVTDEAGRLVTVREVLDHVDRPSFRSVDDVAAALRAAMNADEAQTPPDVR